ncbi:MAG: hypothetical protein RMY16_09975 [Nostoc sp. DedQUE12b]|nr:MULTISPECIES: hypothetical protein [unclassified Nostoc]MDZ7950398.1 hypothetical protein [Nostoc sp. DedQUE09]MDZ8085877.1 hypothetical protein [Nostoc sp. DedQUE12b]
MTFEDQCLHLLHYLFYLRNIERKAIASRISIIRSDRLRFMN